MAAEPQLEHFDISLQSKHLVLSLSSTHIMFGQLMVTVKIGSASVDVPLKTLTSMVASLNHTQRQHTIKPDNESL